MTSGKKETIRPGRNGANLGSEATLRAAADKLCINMDAAEYKHVVLDIDAQDAHGNP